MSIDTPTMIRTCDSGHASLDAANWRCPWCEIERLRAEVEALRKDAERYCYIRDNHEVKGRAMEIVYGMNGADWDAAIDAAIAQERET